MLIRCLLISRVSRATRHRYQQTRVPHASVSVCCLSQQEKACDDKVLLEFLHKAKETKEKVGGLAICTMS